MKVDPTSLVSPIAALERALDDRSVAANSVGDSFALSDRVEISPAALGRAAPTAAQAVTDMVTTSVAVEAAASVMEAEKERFSALIFVLAHHGPPLG